MLGLLRDRGAGLGCNPSNPEDRPSEEIFLSLFKAGRVFKDGGGIHGHKCLLQSLELKLPGGWKSPKPMFMAFFMVNLGQIPREQLEASLQR